MKFARMAEYFERIESTPKRLEMYAILSEMFMESGPGEIKTIVLLSQGRISPPFEGTEMGMSEKLVLRTLSEASGVRTARAEELYAELGDLGTLAENLLAKGRGALEVDEVFAELLAIARLSGKGSVESKINLLASLLRGVSAREARYLVRFVLGKLRLGAGDPTVLEALALSEGDRTLKTELERAYNLCSDLGLVAETLKREGMDGIRAFRIRVGYPVRMALCERLPSSADIIAKIGRAAIEAKYDGLRLQIHRDTKGHVEIFSRNLERMTHMFPEVVSAIKSLPADSLIMEGEAVAHNESTGELLPFQVTIQRRRKHDIAGKAEDIPLRFFAFELLYQDGEDCTVLPYKERRARLVSLILAAKDQSVITPAVMFETDRAEDIDAHFAGFVETGLEGVVAKRLDSPYSAGGRNFNWIKLKRSYRGELADSVDLCIVGYFRGKGARARFGLGALLGAVYEPSDGTFRTVSKIGTGFTEEDLASYKAALDDIALKHRDTRVHSLIDADVWVEPRYVISVTADEITRSPLHTAGMDSDAGGQGYALRFPRITSMRPDKRPEDATTVSELVSLASSQKTHKLA